MLLQEVGGYGPTYEQDYCHTNQSLLRHKDEVWGLER